MIRPTSEEDRVVNDRTVDDPFPAPSDRGVPPEMGRLSVEMTLVNNRDRVLAEAGVLAPEKVRRSTLQGVVDTGAARLVLPEHVADELGLESAGEAKVRYADQRTATRRMAGEIRVRLNDREGVFSAVLEPNRTTALIGAIVLEELDLLVDYITGKLHPRDPERIVSEIESVDDES